MNILFIGDVVGSAGCRHLAAVLPAVKKQYSVDVCIVNGENSADGNGITCVSANTLFNAGADAITTGNHVFRRPEVYELLDQQIGVLRPANYPDTAPGSGVFIVDKGRFQVAVINLLGVVYMEPLACPFDTLKAILQRSDLPACRIVDMHAEATAEKKALAFFADGRVSAVLGTHTHVQTADEVILDQGTAYITDIGMTGPQTSVIGCEVESIIKKMVTGQAGRFQVATGKGVLCAVLMEFDDCTNKPISIQRIQIRE